MMPLPSAEYARLVLGNDCGIERQRERFQGGIEEY